MSDFLILKVPRLSKQHIPYKLLIKSQFILFISLHVPTYNHHLRGPTFWLTSRLIPEDGAAREQEAQQLKREDMNHNQQSIEGKHDDDTQLTEFLSSLMDYTPTVLNWQKSFIFFYSSFDLLFIYSLVKLYLLNWQYSIDVVSFPADTWRIGGALHRQERLSMSRCSIVSTLVLRRLVTCKTNVFR